MDIRFLAYCLATAFWESAWTLEPVREIGLGRGKPYGIPNPATKQTYYGRGIAQVTWYANYLKLSKLLKIDCVNHPDLLLNIEYAAPALFIGLEQGIFTGKKLSDYFHGNHSDPVNARRCVNGTDHAQSIASFYASILHALQGAS